MSHTHSNRLFALIALIICLFYHPGTQAADSPSEPDHKLIRSIHIHGVQRTDTSTIQLLSGLITGTPFDTVETDSAKAKLLRIGRFSKADIVKVFKDEGVDIYLFLEELPSIRLSDIGGELYSRKYGEQDRWWRMRVGITDENFRGRMERLTFNFSFWEWRSLGAFWSKPILTTPYFIGLGSSIARYPYDIRNYDYRDITARITAGRQLNHSARIALSIIPTQRTRIGRAPGISESGSPAPDTTTFYEAFTILGLVNDHRSRRFDPDKGYFVSTALRTNTLYQGLNNPLWQLSNDINLYIPGFFPDHKFAFRLYNVLRATDAGSYHRILYGGDGQVRGYHTKQIGWNHIANNSALFSAEYRFAIWNAPEMYLPLINLMFTGTNVVSWRLDGALFFDYARMWPAIKDIFSTEGRVETARGFGAGLRVLFPAIQTSGCLDIAFGEKKGDGESEKSFSLPPMAHLYLNLHF